MKRKIAQTILIFLLLGIIVLAVNSCGKDRFNECVSGSGTPSSEQRDLYSFRNVAVYDNIDLNIVQGDHYEVKIDAGENIIPMITTRIESNKLTIRNESTCPMFKDPWKGVAVTLIIPEFDTLEIYSHGKVTCSDSLRMENVRVYISENTGKVDLTFSVFRLYVGYNNGTSQVFIRGKAHTGIFYTSAYGPMDCTGFFPIFMIINSNSTNDCYVSSGEKLLDAKITSIGNIYYRGEPDTIIQDYHSSGRLIKLD
jgi:hypothetical protein